MASLKQIEGGFSETSKYNLKLYNEYLQKLVKQVVELQSNVKKASKQIQNTVMVKGKWYDDSAAKFAFWWNNNTTKASGLADGVDKLNNVSTVAEELVRITGVDVSVQMSKSKKFAQSYLKHKYIVDFSKGSEHIHEIENITKKTLGNIAQIECDENAELLADKQALSTMIKSISKAFDNIDSAITEIKKLVKNYVIEGKALKLKGLDSTTLNKKIQNVKGHLDAISQELYNRLKADQDSNNLTDSDLKKALSTNYSKNSSGKSSSKKNSSAGVTVTADNGKVTVVADDGGKKPEVVADNGNVTVVADNGKVTVEKD